MSVEISYLFFMLQWGKNGEIKCAAVHWQPQVPACLCPLLRGLEMCAMPPPPPLARPKALLPGPCPAMTRPCCARLRRSSSSAQPPPRAIATPAAAQKVGPTKGGAPAGAAERAPAASCPGVGEAPWEREGVALALPRDRRPAVPVAVGEGEEPLERVAVGLPLPVQLLDTVPDVEGEAP